MPWADAQDPQPGVQQGWDRWGKGLLKPEAPGRAGLCSQGVPGPRLPEEAGSGPRAGGGGTVSESRASVGSARSPEPLPASRTAPGLTQPACVSRASARTWHLPTSPWRCVRAKASPKHIPLLEHSENSRIGPVHRWAGGAMLDARFRCFSFASPRGFPWQSCGLVAVPWGRTGAGAECGVSGVHERTPRLQQGTWVASEGL